MFWFQIFLVCSVMDLITTNIERKIIKENFLTKVFFFWLNSYIFTNFWIAHLNQKALNYSVKLHQTVEVHIAIKLLKQQKKLFFLFFCHNDLLKFCLFCLCFWNRLTKISPARFFNQRHLCHNLLSLRYPFTTFTS